jgi:hypothetical protein
MKLIDFVQIITNEMIANKWQDKEIVFQTSIEELRLLSIYEYKNEIYLDIGKKGQ